MFDKLAGTSVHVSARVYEYIEYPLLFRIYDPCLILVCCGGLGCSTRKVYDEDSALLYMLKSEDNCGVAKVWEIYQGLGLPVWFYGGNK